MATYLCRIQTIQRGEGRSAVAAAAYRAGQSLVDQRLAMDFDFAGKAGVEFSEILTPEGAPVAYRDRETLWNAAELSEQRRDAVPAREILLALPHELDFEQRRDLVRAFVAQHLTARGMIADVAMHRPVQEGDQRNYHAHILVTTRRVSPQGFGRKEPDWRTPAQVREWRAGWAQIQNEHLRRHLGPGAPQVSHLTLAEQGLDRAPGEHLGPSSTALERRQKRTDRGERNRDIAARNDAAARSRQDYSATADRLAAAAPRIEAPVEALITEAQRVRDAMVAERALWEAQRNALGSIKVPSTRRLAADLLDDDQSRRLRAQAALKRTEDRIATTRRRRLELVQWIRNPARMIWAKHAELNALARARGAAREAELHYAFRAAWVRSPEGRAVIETRRQPSLENAAEASRAQRTLVRKIKRMDRRIIAGTRTVNDLRVARELGVSHLTVPAHSPDATRFIRDVGAPAREALARYPAPARRDALDRLNRGQSLGQSLFPGR